TKPPLSFVKPLGVITGVPTVNGKSLLTTMLSAKPALTAITWSVLKLLNTNGLEYKIPLVRAGVVPLVVQKIRTPEVGSVKVIFRSLSKLEELALMTGGNTEKLKLALTKSLSLYPARTPTTFIVPLVERTKGMPLVAR